MARPSKYQTHVAPRLEEIRDWVRNGATEEEIALRLGISRDSLYAYKREFSEFSDTIKKGKEYTDGEVENALLKSALAGSVTAQIFWLKNRRPDKWSDKPEERGHEDRQLNINVTIEKLSDNGEAEENE